MENSFLGFSGKSTPADLRAILDSYGNSIDQYVHFGSQLVERDSNRDMPEKRDGYIVPLLYLRNLVENIDAIGILIRHGASDPCKSLLRTVVENFFSLEYLHESPDQRSMCYHVWNTYQHIKLYEKLDGHSDRAKQFNAQLSQDKFMRPAGPMISPFVDNLKASANKLLALDHYKDVVAEYQRTVTKTRNPQWYSLFDGPINVEGLASHSKFFGLYELYRSLSNNVHGTDVAHDKISGIAGGRINVLPLRYPKDADMITGFVHELCLAAFYTYMQKRLPEKQGDFDRWEILTRPFREKMGKGEFIKFHD